MTTAVLNCAGVGHRHGRHGTWGLRACTLAVPAGRVVAVVGPNGAGKTTLLHLAAGLLAPTEGSVQVAGAVPEQRLERIGSPPRTRPYGLSCASVTSSASAPTSTPAGTPTWPATASPG